ncbi:hypothetical protein EBR96_07410, partial [bacterium]|nr:hypothetical protein [bacterium]
MLPKQIAAQHLGRPPLPPTSPRSSHSPRPLFAKAAYSAMEKQINGFLEVSISPDPKSWHAATEQLSQYLNSFKDARGILAQRPNVYLHFLPGLSDKNKSHAVNSLAILVWINESEGFIRLSQNDFQSAKKLEKRLVRKFPDIEHAFNVFFAA